MTERPVNDWRSAYRRRNAAPARQGTRPVRGLRFPSDGHGANFVPMPNFVFTAIDASGARHRGVREAASVGDLSATLEREGLFVLSLSDTPTDHGARWGRSPFGDAALLEGTRALAALLSAGLPLARALTAVAQLGSPRSAVVWHAVRAAVESGSTLAEALGAHPRFFPPHYVGLVRAGERSGALAPAFARLADELERDAQLRSRVLSAALYPVILLVAGGAAVLVLLLVVIPNFAALLPQTGAPLPTSTAMVLTLGQGLRRFWYLIPGGLVALVAIIEVARSSAEGRRWLSRAWYALPLIGGWRRDLAAARFARLAGTLLEGGAPLLVALDDTARSLDDPLVRECAERVHAATREGQTLQQALAAEILFPPMLAQLVGVGEAASSVPLFLMKAAQLFEERNERAVRRLVTLLEPAMIIVFGGVVGFIALALLQAIYSVNAGSFR